MKTAQQMVDEWSEELNRKLGHPGVSYMKLADLLKAYGESVKEECAEEAFRHLIPGHFVCGAAKFAEVAGAIRKLKLP